jgi:hypothetical protein
MRRGFDGDGFYQGKSPGELLGVEPDRPDDSAGIEDGGDADLPG